MRKRLSSLLLIASVASCWASTTINTTNKYAYGANIGWSDWRGGTSSGGQFQLSGTIDQPDAGVLTGGQFKLEGGF